MQSDDTLRSSPSATGTHPYFLSLLFVVPRCTPLSPHFLSCVPSCPLSISPSIMLKRFVAAVAFAFDVAFGFTLTLDFGVLFWCRIRFRVRFRFAFAITVSVVVGYLDFRFYRIGMAAIRLTLQLLKALLTKDSDRWFDFVKDRVVVRYDSIRRMMEWMWWGVQAVAFFGRLSRVPPRYLRRHGYLVGMWIILLYAATCYLHDCTWSIAWSNARFEIHVFRLAFLVFWTLRMSRNTCIGGGWSISCA